jgi:hypothetical protein
MTCEKIHKSSAAKPFHSLNQEYQDASELGHYDTRGTGATSSEVPHARTWKVVCSSVSQRCSDDNTGSATRRVNFHVDVQKMIREERFSQLNEEFKGRSTIVNSSASDE